MGLNKGDLAKVPAGLSAKECYKQIHEWHRKNSSLILQKLSNRDPNDSYIKSYFEFVKKLPDPATATPADIESVCKEVTMGRMEWAYHLADDKGVKTAAYAEYALGSRP